MSPLTGPDFPSPREARQQPPHQKNRQSKRNMIRKKLECKFCGTLHSCTFNLRQHERGHTGEKPYKCLHCDVSFTRQWLLNRHTNTLHPGTIDQSDTIDGGFEPSVDTPEIFNQSPVTLVTPEAPNTIPLEIAGGLTELEKNIWKGDFTFGGKEHSPSLPSRRILTDQPEDFQWPNATMSADPPIPGVDETDASTWTYTNAVPPPPPQITPEYECNECGHKDPSWTAALQLQAHRHEEHNVPRSPSCLCDYCRYATFPLEALAPVPGPIVDQVAIDPRLLMHFSY